MLRGLCSCVMQKKKKVAYCNTQSPCFAHLCVILLPLELWPEPAPVTLPIHLQKLGEKTEHMRKMFL